MNSNITMAVISMVDLGAIQTTGLMSEFDEFGIGVPQFCNLFSVRTNNAKKDIESLLDIERGSFSFVQWKTPLNSKAINVLTVTQFGQLVKALIKKGNPVAIELASDLIDLGLLQRFSDSFGKKFEKEDRDLWSKNRVGGKVSRLQLTDVLQDWEKKQTFKNPYLYSDTTNAIYGSLFGADTKAIKLLLKVPVSKPTRDYMSPKALKALDIAEESIALMIDEGTNPHQAVQIYFSAKFVRQVSL